MKRFLILCTLLFLSIGMFAQGPFTGFFKSSKTLGGDYARRADGSEREWFFRPAAQITAVQFTYDKDLKQFESATFSSAGIGISYQHYTDVGETLVNNFGFNAMVIFDASQSSQGGVGLAATINALQFVNVGAGYNLTDKQFFLLTGAIWTF